METLSYCQLMERCLAAEARVVELAAENVALKEAAEFATAPDMWIEQADGMLDYRYCDWYVDVLKAVMETPATDRIVVGIKADAVKGIYSFNKVDYCVYLDGDVCMLIDAYEASLRESTK